MGTWNLDAAAAGAYVTRFVYFNGDVYAFTVSGASWGGVWRYDGPGVWTQVCAIASTGEGCLWDGALWTHDRTGATIYRSVNGTNWTADADLQVLGGNPNLEIRSINGGPALLYCALRDSAAAEYYIWTRTADGVWSLGVGPWTVALPGDAIGGVGGYEFYNAQAGTAVQRWTGGGWEDTPNLEYNSVFTYDPVTDTLYAKEDDTGGSGPRSWIHRLDAATDEWILENTDLNYASANGCISIGGDGIPYSAVQRAGAGSRVYWRPVGGWELHSSTGAGMDDFMTAGADAGGNPFAGDDAAPSLFRYVPSFDVAPGDPTDPARGQGLAPEALRVDPDGHIYVALYDVPGATPRLIRASLPLAEDQLGTSVFSTGAGDAIGVEVGQMGGRLAVHGNFGAGDAVEVSEDYGANWDNIGGAWGAETAQPLEMEDLDHIVVALQTAQDIVRTEDGGTLWTVVNPAVGYGVDAMAKHEVSDEMILSGDGTEIDFSPNAGQTLHGIGGPGDASALEVV